MAVLHLIHTYGTMEQLTPNISGLAAGIYNLTITDANGCTTNMPLTVGTNTIPVTTTVDTVVCANLLPFNWHNFIVNAGGLYQFITQNALGCDSIIKLNVTVRLITRSTTVIQPAQINLISGTEILIQHQAHIRLHLQMQRMRFYSNVDIKCETDTNIKS
jgi:hypothetical protein